jgi:molybdopterin-containing oxidoreductase family membrane subunit
MWAGLVLAVVALSILLRPSVRSQSNWLAVACVATVVSVWIEKGLGMVVAGFIPSPLGHVTRYVPTASELFIGLGIYGIGALIVTILYKTALSVRGEVA